MDIAARLERMALSETWFLEAIIMGQPAALDLIASADKLDSARYLESRGLLLRFNDGTGLASTVWGFPRGKRHPAVSTWLAASADRLNPGDDVQA